MTPSRNNFDIVRTVLALIVLFVHAATLSADPALQWFHRVLDSDYAIKGFFVISGYLVMKSFNTSDTLALYAEKRVRRIYPAYLAAIALCFVIGLAVTSLDRGAFLTEPQTWKYLAVNTLFLNFLQHDLPGVFASNPMSAMNGSLWTIKIEVALYIGLPLLALIMRWWGVTVTAILVSLASIGWVYFFTYGFDGPLGPMLARQAPGQAVYFALGACLQLRPDWKRPLPWIALASLVPYMLSQRTVFEPLLEPVFVVSSIIYVSDRALPALHAGRFGDLSYGLYLYHFPVIQLLVSLGLFAVNPWLGLVVALVITTILAKLSWEWLEKRWLKRSSHYRLATEREMPGPRR